MPMDAAGVGAAMQAMSGLRAAASSGGFAVDAAGGQALLKAITDMKDGVAEAQSDMYRLKEAAKLGTSPDAEVMIAFNQQVADGDEQSFTQVLEQFKNVLDEAENAVKQAMSNYGHVDTANQAMFNQGV